jgi:integrase
MPPALRGGHGRQIRPTPKQIQSLTGHSSIKVTFDTCGHLFSDNEAHRRAAKDIRLRLLGV